MGYPHTFHGRDGDRPCDCSWEADHGDYDPDADKIANLVEALEDVNDDEMARQTIGRLGIDIKAWAAEIRAKVVKGTEDT